MNSNAEMMRKYLNLFENKKMKDDPCWKGYKMVGTKKKKGKEVPNCVPESVTENLKLPSENLKNIFKSAIRNFGHTYDAIDFLITTASEEEKAWIENNIDYIKKLFRKNGLDSKPMFEKSLTKKEEKNKEKYVKGMKKDKKGFKKRYGDDAEKVMYATATKMAKESTDTILMSLEEKFSLLEKEAGMSDAERKTYNRKHGSNLKRAQPGGGKRRTSYCARSKGQMDMHNINCRKTPDKKICKARRDWNC